MKFIVQYSDGSEQTVVEKDQFEAAARVEETVEGCDYAIMPTKIVGEDGHQWLFKWNLQLHRRE